MKRRLIWDDRSCNVGESAKDFFSLVKLSRSPPSEKNQGLFYYIIVNNRTINRHVKVTCILLGSGMRMGSLLVEFEIVTDKFINYVEKRFAKLQKFLFC